MLKTITKTALGAAMVYAGYMHLTKKRDEFQDQVPDWIPVLSKDEVVVYSGYAEIGLGLGMLFNIPSKKTIGKLLAAFYIAIFPGNISQFVEQRDGFGLDTDEKRFTRLLFQPVLVWLARWSTK